MGGCDTYLKFCLSKCLRIRALAFHSCGAFWGHSLSYPCLSRHPDKAEQDSFQTLVVRFLPFHLNIGRSSLCWSNNGDIYIQNFIWGKMPPAVVHRPVYSPGRDCHSVLGAEHRHVHPVWPCPWQVKEELGNSWSPGGTKPYPPCGCLFDIWWSLWP